MSGFRLRPHQALVVGLLGALGVWLAEQIVGPGELRHELADLGWTGFALGATVATARAALVPLKRDRRAWILIFLGAFAWAIGQLFSDIYDIAGITTTSPTPSDV